MFVLHLYLHKHKYGRLRQLKLWANLITFFWKYSVGNVSEISQTKWKLLVTWEFFLVSVDDNSRTKPFILCPIYIYYLIQSTFWIHSRRVVVLTGDELKGAVVLIFAHQRDLPCAVDDTSRTQGTLICSFL